MARRLGVSQPTVQRWVDAGHLLAWKTPGGHRRIDAASAERLIEAQRRPAVAGVAPAPAPQRVVVVDDNPDDRELLTAIVQTALPDAELRVFESGIQALVAIGHTSADLVITDLNMPHMDGAEMLRQLAAHCLVRPRRIIAISADCDAAGHPRTPLPEGVGFFAKPLDAQRLVAELRA